MAGDVETEEQLVVFALFDEEYAVPIGAVQEIVRIPAVLMRVPQSPDFIEGMMNLRGAAVAVIDGRRRFGLPSAARDDRQRIIVFGLGAVRRGFMVDSVASVLRVPLQRIGPAPLVGAEQRRLIRRVVNLVEQKRMILILDVDALIAVDVANAAAAAAA